MKTIKGSLILDLIEHWHIGSVTWQDLRNHLEGKILVDEKELLNRLETLKSDAVKYKDCEFNAPKIREGMILQLEEILKDG